MKLAYTLPLLLASLTANHAHAQVVRKGESLPGYYGFYLKEGRLQRLEPEAKRDEKLAAGELGAQRMEQPLPALALPLESGSMLDFQSFRSKKNLVVATYRAWW